MVNAPSAVVAPVPPFATATAPLSLVASTDVVGIVISAEPSNAVAVPVTAPLRAMFTALARAFAVPAFPVTSVCAGWTWSPRANVPVSVPTVAVPAAFGVVPDAFA